MIYSYARNVLFIEYSDDKREKIRNYINEIAYDDSCVLLIGNDDILPFEKTPSPVDDGDGLILTDNYWSSKSKDMLYPDLTVSRIPNAKDEKLNDFLNKVENIFKIDRINSNERFGITAKIWTKAANAVFKNIKGTGEILNSPPYSIKNSGKIEFDDFNGALYFNLHGDKDIKGWYGQRGYFETGEEYPLAIMPDSFDSGIEKTFLLSEACFGGYIVNKKNNESIPLNAIKNGARFVIASTSTAYGPYNPPLSEADLFMEFFIKELNKGKESGQAFKNAKRKFIVYNIQKNGFLDNDDKKTVLQFTFYGNPFIKVKNE